ncbi:outer membrane protein [Loktanella sp. S4079]|uniref:outer membrane protein n=1 Tax=Loktanella sp. S4079 TaxID=579483 RepID=UPI0005F9AE03|nr:outer membrane beta-barrel protein [Loktanella sp. S4079]KJZ19520.1 lipid A oxidase [Loktanella sp. S4079]
MSRAIALSALLLVAPAVGSAEVELSFYGGVQSAPASDVKVRDPEIGDDDFSISWEGKSFSAPVYYGIRATRWNDDFGYGLDFAHNKVYPKDGELPAGYDVLEFTDGLNTLTVNAYRRWDHAFGDMTPYVGGGLGIAIPHVEVTNGTSETAEYQVTGPAATWVAGATYPINDRWAVFGEYKGTYSTNKADLESGGTVETDVFTNAVNMGVSFNF